MLLIVGRIYRERAMNKLTLAVWILLVCALAPWLAAQTNNATLGGTVTDSSAALIPGVTITARNIDTGIVTTVVSNETGAYQFAALQPGKYRVSAELPGFRTYTYDNV